MAGEKFGDAYRLLERAMPLPEILGRICDAPCRAACKRGEIGDPVDLPALERACVMHAPRKETSALRHGSGRRVIVLGGGPTGLAAASDLSARACEVLVITPCRRIGARLHDIRQGLLPESVLKKELSRLMAAGVRFETQHPLDDTRLTALLTTADAVFIGLDDPELPAGWWRRFSETSDPITLETSTKGLFCGGFSAVNGKASFVFDMAEGRKGALSIDRFLKGISLTANRPLEGVRQTRLHTDICGIEPAKTVSARDPKGGYSLSEAALEAKRCLQCECLVCARACDYLSTFGGYPLKFAREFENFKGVTLWRNRENQLINSCSLCGLCETLCPEQFPFPEVCREARRSLVERRKMPPSFHEFALMDMAFSTGQRAALLKGDPATESCRHLFFPGCQLTASLPLQVRRTYEFLRNSLSGGVGLMLYCCGVPAKWACRDDLFTETIGRIHDYWMALEKPTVWLACPSCQVMFNEYLPQIKSVSLYAALPDVPWKEAAFPPSESRGIGVCDPCAARHDTAVQKAVRGLLSDREFSIEKIPFNGQTAQCCGFGGLMAAANPELAEKVISGRIRRGAPDWVTYCAMCRDRLVKGGKRIAHVLQILFPDADADPFERPAPGWSERHENRGRLKETLLAELWHESAPAKGEVEAIPLILSSEIRALMETRRILATDIQKVIAHAQSGGRFLKNPKTGRMLAYFRPMNVTFWVEYSNEAAGVAVHNLYCHRMEILEAVP